MDEKLTLRHLHNNVYEDVAGGRERLFERYVEHGEVQYWHESGYGYLPANRVIVQGEGT